MMYKNFKLASTFALSFSIGTTLVNADEFPFDVPSMVEQSKEAGIEHTYEGPWEYFVGGGAASFDCNGDRMPDVFLSGGKSAAKLFINTSSRGGNLSFAEKALDIGRSNIHRYGGYRQPRWKDPAQRTDRWCSTKYGA